MVGAHDPSPIDDRSGPSSLAHPGADSGSSQPAAVRSNHLRDEAYVRALGRLNYLYALLLGIPAAYFMRLTLLHLSGTLDAPWSVRPGWLALQIDGCLITLLALAAGHGLRRLKPWALKAELLFVIGFLAAPLISVVAHSTSPQPGEFIGEALMCTALLIPLVPLCFVRDSLLFDPAYRGIIEATPETQVKVKLPWRFKLAALLLYMAGMAIYAATSGT